MRNPNSFSFIDVDSGNIAYCSNCEKAGIQSRLQDLIILEGQDPKPDADNWCQCHRCGKIYPIYERKQEGQFSYFKDVVTNPFDSTSTFESVKKRKHKDRLGKVAKDEEQDFKAGNVRIE